MKARLIGVLVSCIGGTLALATLTPRPAATQDVDELIARLASPGAMERATAACALGRMSAEEVRRARDELLGLLADGTEVEGPLCRERRGSFRGRFDESSPGREAALALEELGLEVLEALVVRLRDPVPAGRENAALALGLVESSQAVEALAEAVAQDTDSRVRARAAWALGMIESSSGVDPLLTALRDDSADVREQAAWALGMIESVSAVEGLVPVLSSDPAAAVRREAAWALGMIESPAAAEPLMEALEDEDPEVREEAMWALGMVLQGRGFGAIDRGALADAVRRALRGNI